MAFKIAAKRPRNDFVLVEAWGREKSGKTFWAMTAPAPIYFFNFDKGYDRVEKYMLKNSDTIPIDPPFVERYSHELISVADYSGQVNEDAVKLVDDTNAEALLKEFEKDWLDMLRREPGGTAIIDTGTILWNLASQVLQRKAPANQSWIQYTYRNEFFRRLLVQARESGKNVVFLHHDTDIYNSEGNISGQKAQGDKLISRGADVICRSTSVKNKKGGRPDYILKIEDCGLDSSHTGMELTNSTWDDLMDLVNP